MDRERLAKVLDKLSVAVGRIEGRRSALIEEKIKCIEIADGARRIRDNHSDVRESLTKLQLRAQKTQIQGIESLLTDVSRSVFDGFQDKVRLQLKVSRNIPNLEIFMETKDGFKESVISSRGGSLANVLATAIPFIGLAKSGNRPLIVLDEPDCWIEPGLIKRFFKMLAELSYRLNMQVVVITHHEDVLFQDYADIVTLAKNGEDVCIDTQTATKAHELAAQFKSDDERSELMVGAGIQSLGFTNVGKISKCVIPLSSNMTVIRGSNEIGKSTLFSCLKSVMYQSDARPFVSHSAEKAIVEIGVEGGVTAVARIKSGNKDIEYSAYIDGKEVDVNELGGVQGLFGVKEVQGRDLHFPHQLTPLGVLSPDISNSERAKMLASDPVSERITAMIAKYGEMHLQSGRDLKVASERQKAIEIELERLQKYEVLAGLYAELKERNKGLGETVDKWNRDRSLLARYKKLAPLNIMSGMPVVSARQDIEKGLEVLQKAQRFNELLEARHIFWNARKRWRRRLINEEGLDAKVAKLFNKAAHRFCELDFLKGVATQCFNSSEKLAKSSISDGEVMKHMSRFIELSRWANASLRKLPSIGEVSTSRIGKVLDYLKLSAKKVEFESALSEDSDQLHDIDNQLEELSNIKEGVCPCCYQPVDGNTLKHAMRSGYVG